MSGAAGPGRPPASDAPVAVIGLGGTIAMTAGPRGLAPGLSLADLVGAAASGGPPLRLVERAARPSASLGFEDLAALAADVAALRAEGVAGVVVVQGTDTLEETAFGLELLAGAATPIVFTGAMRAPAQAGSDGPANLAAALLTARSGSLGAGVLVVLNDEVHAARHVAKAHTTALGAFTSGDFGPVGRIHEGRVRTIGGPLADLGVVAPRPTTPWPKVALVRLAVGQEPDLLRALPGLGYRGLVLEAMGAGHAPAGLVEDLERLARAMPVVLCSRTGRGRVCEATYGYAGSETDLLGRGLVSGGALAGLKARIALTLVLAAGGPEPIDAFRAIAGAV